MNNSKDRISLYMFRNSLATFFITFVAMLWSFFQYYQCSLAEGLQRLFFYDIYTSLYFVLLWLCNYIIFEISKIIYDIYEEKVTFIPCVALIILSIVIFFVPILDLFKYNISLLCLLISARMVKEMWKRTPQLFYFIHKLFNKIKRPKNVL